MRREESQRSLGTIADSVSIRPGTAILSVLRHLNYKPWFALAEFVDNSVQSYVGNRELLQSLDGFNSRVRVSIDFDSTLPARITIRDNAAGISQADFPRAFRPAAIPPDASGLNEFGMGMKSAACWFSPYWQVRTSVYGEAVERKVTFDVRKIVTDSLEEIEISTAPCASKAHFTEIVLDTPFQLPVGRTIGKIREHLADIYRFYIRNGVLELRVAGETLAYEEPSILEAPYVRSPDGPVLRWKKDIEFDLGGGQWVRGFAALRDPGNFAKSGFALFRRNRLVQGSGEEGYRPASIFGASSSYRHLRLFGELSLDGFEVSHTKDGFRWGDDEEPFLELLREHLDSEEMPLLRQAEGFRALVARRDRQRVAAEALENAASALEEALPGVVTRLVDLQPTELPNEALATEPMLASRELRFGFRGRAWLIRIELADDPVASEWLSVGDSRSDSGSVSVELLEIRIAMTHPFMVRFAQTRPEEIEAIIRVAAAFALAEKLARDAAVRFAGTVRRNANDILTEALSRL